MNATPSASNMAPMRLDLTGGLLQPALVQPDLRDIRTQASALPNVAPAAVNLPAAAPVRLAPVASALRAPPAAASAQAVQSATPAKSAQAARAEQKYFGAAAAKAREKGVKTAFEGIQLPLPAGIGSMSAAQAAASLHDDFLGRIGSYKVFGAGVRSFASAVMPQRSPLARLQPAALSREAGVRKDESRSMPSVERDDPARSASPDDTSGLDELGNPRRHQDPGPDSVSDSGGRGFSESGGGSRNSDLFALAAPVLGGLAVAGGLAAFAPAALVLVPLYLGVVVPSLILHEMGHAWAADRLGYPTPREQRRLSFRPRDLLTHIDPTYTLALPILTLLTSGVIFGGARPVQMPPSTPHRDMALVALAGPAVNFGLAVAVSAAHAVAAALGVGGVVASLLATTVFINVMLGAFNLLPLFPLDGHHVVRYLVADVLKAPRLAAELDSLGGLQFVGLMAMVIFFGGALTGAVQGVSAFLLSAAGLLFQAPAVAVGGLLAGRFGGRPRRPAAASAPAGTPVGVRGRPAS